MNDVLNIKDWLAASNGIQFEYVNYGDARRLKDGKVFGVFDYVRIKNKNYGFYIHSFMPDNIHVRFSETFIIPINDIEEFYPPFHLKKT